MKCCVYFGADRDSLLGEGAFALSVQREVAFRHMKLFEGTGRRKEQECEKVEDKQKVCQQVRGLAGGAVKEGDGGLRSHCVKSWDGPCMLCSGLGRLLVRQWQSQSLVRQQYC